MEMVKKTFLATKAADKQTNDDSLWAVATCEIEDSTGDVVKTAGVSYGNYHNPPNTYLKILAGHKHILDDGSPAVVGRVEEFSRGNLVVGDGKSVPALYFRMSWAKDGEGYVTDLAAKYKALYDGGYLDSFSVGMILQDFTKNKAGGRDIQASELHEISAVSVPMLAKANVVKHIEETLGIKLDVKTLEDEVEKKITEEPYGYKDVVKAMGSMFEPIVKSQNELLEQNKALAERLDVLESAIVVLTDVAKVQRQDDQKGLTQEQSQKLLKEIDKINTFLGK